MCQAQNYFVISNVAILQSRCCYSHFADEETDLERLSDLLKTTLLVSAWTGIQTQFYQRAADS